MEVVVHDFFFFSSRRRHTRYWRDWSSDVCSSDLLTGWFTPTEAGLVAVVYILVVAIPALNWRHVSELPLDFVKAGLLHSIPLITVAAASAFGWMLAYLRGPDLVSDWITV